MNARSMAYLAALLTYQSVSANPSAEDRITEKLKVILPGVPVTAISPSPLKGLYEVAMGGNVFYMSDDARYILRGDLMELDAEPRNLSSERREELRVTVLRGIDRSETIEFAPKDAKHLLYVFTDVDCGYCRRFHSEIARLNDAGIAVRYLAFPRTAPGTASYKKSEAVWCSKDQQKALTEAKQGKDVQAPACANPVAKHQELGSTLGVRGTPAIFAEDGKELGGYVPADKLVHYFNGAL